MPRTIQYPVAIRLRLSVRQAQAVRAAAEAAGITVAEYIRRVLAMAGGRQK